MSENVDKLVPGFMAGSIITAAFTPTVPFVFAGAVIGAIISYNFSEKDSDGK